MLKKYKIQNVIHVLHKKKEKNKKTRLRFATQDKNLLCIINTYPELINE